MQVYYAHEHRLKFAGHFTLLLHFYRKALTITHNVFTPSLSIFNPHPYGSFNYISILNIPFELLRISGIGLHTIDTF